MSASASIAGGTLDHRGGRRRCECDCEFAMRARETLQEGTEATGFGLGIKNAGRGEVVGPRGTASYWVR
jgi:hypothetical protein